MRQAQILQLDPWLADHSDAIHARIDYFKTRRQELLGEQSLSEFASGHLYYGLQFDQSYWTFRESLPHADAVYILCDRNNWQKNPSFALNKISDSGDWELCLDQSSFKNGDQYRLLVEWPGGSGERLPAYCTRVAQNEHNSFNALIHYDEIPYKWQHDQEPRLQSAPLIYECHIGMAQEQAGVGNFNDFTELVLPRIIKAGYNAIQIMALMEHPYYGSFGYQVSNFFALSSRFGEINDFKRLVDTCHKNGIAVIMDLIHSHAVKNEVEGISLQDGTSYQYFHDGDRGQHPAWDSRCFDYGKSSVLHFLLSNCKYWLEHFHLDGFRFDGVTSMLYTHHGLGVDFDHYGKYFDDNVDKDAVFYLSLANQLIHEIHPQAICIAEDMSGMPGTCLGPLEGGLGFDYRLAMGTPDMWTRLIDKSTDEDWSVTQIYQQLHSRRSDCKTISYAESHDQALVGDKCISFRLMDKAMYDGMQRGHENLIIERGIALHKMIRLITFCAGGEAYLNFMGNEFGHPEWIDFPREGNNWSYAYARRQWQLCDDPTLRYSALAAFDQAMLKHCAAYLGTGTQILGEHESNQWLVFSLGPLVCVFNFNPSQSFPDLAITLNSQQFQAYKIILSSDDLAFDGQGRIDCEQEYPVHDGQIRCYVPARCTLIFKGIE